MSNETYTIPEITSDKQAFEYIKEQLLKQGQPSMMAGAESSCAYRGYKNSDLEHAAMTKYGMAYDELEFDDAENILVNLNFSTKCAVGHVISDDKYSSNLEEKIITCESVQLAVIDSNPNWKIDNKSIIMLKNLQFLHDKTRFSDWEEHFKRFSFDEFGNFLSVDTTGHRLIFDNN